MAQKTRDAQQRVSEERAAFRWISDKQTLAVAFFSWSEPNKVFKKKQKEEEALHEAIFQKYYFN